MLAHWAGQSALPHNAAAHTLLMTGPDCHYADATDTAPLPEYLDAPEARRLLTWHCSRQPMRCRQVAKWQGLSDTTALARCRRMLVDMLDEVV